MKTNPVVSVSFQRLLPYVIPGPGGRWALAFLVSGIILFHAPRAWATYPNNINDDEDELAGQLAEGLQIGDTKWFVSEPYINLWVASHPWQYLTKGGRPVDCALAFKQRNSRVEPMSTGPIPSVGWGWECSFISYVKYHADVGWSSICRWAASASTPWTA